MPQTITISPYLQVQSGADVTGIDDINVVVNASNIGELVDQLRIDFPEIVQRMTDDTGAIRRWTLFYVNDKDIRFLKTQETLLNTLLKEGDRVYITPAIIETSVAKAAIEVATRLREKQSLNVKN